MKRSKPSVSGTRRWYPLFVRGTTLSEEIKTLGVPVLTLGVPVVRGTTLSEEIKTKRPRVSPVIPAGPVRGTTLSEEIKTFAFGRGFGRGFAVRGTTLSEEIKTSPSVSGTRRYPLCAGNYSE